MKRAGLSWLIDGGVRGFAQYGLPEAGPLDPRSALAAWTLCGAAGHAEPWWLEIGPLPFAVRFEGAAMVALLGPTRPTRLSGQSLPVSDEGVTGQRFFVEDGTELGLGASAVHGPTYLAVQAELPPPTDGVRGAAIVRRLRDGDGVDVRANRGGRSGRALLEPGAAQSVWSPDGALTVRFLAGPEYGDIRRAVGEAHGARGDAGTDVWVFAASTHMDRRAVRLAPSREGDVAPSPVSLAESSPTVAGLIQWPEGGMPVILRPDRQTMGGYPRFGAVITADRRRLAWISPGDVLALRLVDRAEAMRAYARELRVDRVLERFLRLAGGSGGRS